MSIAEIRPYQPWDTIKQIDRLSTAKKSELMTKLTHQEEQLSLLFCIRWVDKSLVWVQQTLLAAISYAALKTWDLVWAFIGKSYYPASRKKTKYIQRFEKITPNNSSYSYDAQRMQSISNSIMCVVVSDFLTQEQKSLLRTLSVRNSIILLLIGEEESFFPKPWNSYAYDGLDLWWSSKDQYTRLVQEALRTTQWFMQSIWWKCIVIDTWSNPLTQLSKQRIF